MKKLLKNKFFRFFSVFVLAVLLIIAGYYKGYVINLTFNGQGFILPQTPTVAEDTPAESNLFQHFLSNPKWLSSFFFLCIFMLLSAGIIYFVFLKKSYFRLTCLIYLGLAILGFLIILIGNASGFSKTGYFVAQNFKELLLSPFVVMLLVPAFRLLNR